MLHGIRSLALSGARRRATPDRLRAWLFPHTRKEGDVVTSSIARRWLHRAENAAGLGTVPQVACHGFRAGFATWLLNAGVSAEKVARLGGWESVGVVLDVYAQPDDAALEDALETASTR